LLFYTHSTSLSTHQLWLMRFRQHRLIVLFKYIRITVQIIGNNKVKCFYLIWHPDLCMCVLLIFLSASARVLLYFGCCNTCCVLLCICKSIKCSFSSLDLWLSQPHSIPVWETDQYDQHEDFYFQGSNSNQSYDKMKMCMCQL